ncbi:MAG TPA: hypothetical protein VGM98_22520 [Schlesneria sp.]
MAFTIRSIEEQEPGLSRSAGCVEHNGNSIPAIIVGDPQQLHALIGQSISAEIELDEVVSVTSDQQRDDEHSGVFLLPDGQIKVDGTVHHIMQIDSESDVVDVYIRNGPEYIAFDTSGLQGIRPRVDDRLCVYGRRLLVYPTFT